MFLKAGALSLALLLASRVLGLVRESAIAAAFGTSAFADTAVLMLSLPDWITGLVASGALAYVLLPAWAGQSREQVAAMARTVAGVLVAAGVAVAIALIMFRGPASAWLMPGLAGSALSAAAGSLIWSAVAIPLALLAAVWTTRLQHERDFTGMYFANLVVNAVVILAIAWTASRPRLGNATLWLGAGLLLAMALRLAWLRSRMPASTTTSTGAAVASELPALPVWLWAALSAGLPLALPFAARTLASAGGEGALATFNYAWKLVELPLVLAIQLVAALAFPAVAAVLARDDHAATQEALRKAFALAWALACGAAAALLVGSPAIADLLFGWGRMSQQSLALVARWGAIGSWSLLPQALIAVALTVLASRGRLKVAVLAHAAALAVLLSYGVWGTGQGGELMWLLDVLQTAVAVAVVAALGAEARRWLPWRAMAIPLACLAVVAAVTLQLPATPGLWAGLCLAGVAGLAVVGATWWGSSDLRAALAR